MTDVNATPSVRHYFVDEAGDGYLFDRRGHITIGTEGCSRFFILGLVDVADPVAVDGELSELRRKLLADAYFRKVPSMQLEAKKTALAFHAKDDLAEVRREVLNILRRYEFRFFAVVRNKQKVLEYVRQRNETDSLYRYKPNELYDYMVRRLFKTLLHKDDHYNICFATRGASDRTAAMREALEQARRRFSAQWKIASDPTINVTSLAPPQSGGLQVADYFLWALQRLYERREDRYVELLWPSFRLVHDIDDTRKAQYGVYYTQKKPLNAAALEKLPQI
jgi:hypothetical protein